jgi:hypothetical protein
MSDLPRIVFDWPWLLVAALLLPLAAWLLRRRLARRRSERLARFADASALLRLLPLSGTGAGARTARLVTVFTLAGIAPPDRVRVARGPTTARGIDMAIALMHRSR